MNEVVRKDLYLSAGIFVITLFIAPLAVKDDPSWVMVVGVSLLFAAIFLFSRYLILKVSPKKIGTIHFVIGIILLAAGIYIFYSRKDKLIFMILFGLGIIGFVEGLDLLIRKRSLKSSPLAIFK